MAINTVISIFLPPILGALIGYFTNWLAIKMLFRPYTRKSINIPSLNIRLDVPFTPGLFPKEQEKLANKVASTVTGQLLTPDDIQNITIKLVTPENIEQAVDAIVDSILKEFQNIRKLRDISEEIAGLVSAFLMQSLPDIIEDSITTSPVAKEFIEKSIDSVILSISIPMNTAYSITNSFFYHIATPNNIRNWILEMLTPENIDELNYLVQHNTRGSFYYISRIITVKSILENTRDFLKNEPESANETIQEAIKELEIKQKLAENISQFRFESLPYSTVSMLKEHLTGIFINYILQNSKQISDRISREDMTRIITDKIVRFDTSKINPKTIVFIKKEIASFINKYLEQELGTLIEKTIPLMGIDYVISDKIARFSPGRLEKLITDISRRELRGIERIGGFIGFIIGCINSMIFMLSGGIWS
jgi:uncharacterized membrane protein YheB (UPF0754 family)